MVRLTFLVRTITFVLNDVNPHQRFIDLPVTRAAFPKIGPGDFIATGQGNYSPLSRFHLCNPSSRLSSENHVDPYNAIENFDAVTAKHLA